MAGVRWLWVVLVVGLWGCGGGEVEKRGSGGGVGVNYYAQDVGSQVLLTLYDATGVKVGECVGTYVDGDIVCAPLSVVRGSHHGRVSMMTESGDYQVYGYTGYDFRTDLVLLRVGKRNNGYSRRCVEGVTDRDTLFGVSGNREGKIFRHGVRVGERMGLRTGSGVFDTKGRLRGVVGVEGEMVSAGDIDSLVARQSGRHASVYDLRLKSDREYIGYEKVAGFRVRTTMGEFRMRLYDDVAEYRDNFIRLVSDHYYDSLLVHRVLPSFLIQTGAADTKYAKAGDVVGWQGPGYTLPLIEGQRHYHKRGAVAASKLPPDRNPENRCDGGQFYVVAGRKFTAGELDKIGREEHKTFSMAQREAYMTVGGAPHLDGDYVVFGEVTAGMDVVDAISRVELTGDKGDRPLRDVRVLSITIIRK